MENSISKGRHNNFSREEVTKLKELLEKYSVILSKKTDHASSKQKDEAWSQLTNEFNSRNDIYRSKKQLIYKFNNMKKNARKELSQERKERRCTGGGPPPPGPSDTTEWLCGIMGESIVGLPSTHDSDYTQDNTGNSVGAQERSVSLSNIEEEMSVLDIPICNEENEDNIIICEVPNDEVSIVDVQENPESKKFDTSTPYAMMKKPISKPLEPVVRKRKLSFTPHETRKNIGLMAHEKELYIKKKGDREQKLLQFAEEEHTKNMQHIEQTMRMQSMECEFKRKLNELLLKKAAVELEIEEEKLKKLKFENKDF